MTITSTQFLRINAPEVHRTLLNVQEKALTMHRFATGSGDLAARLASVRKTSNALNDGDNWLLRSKFVSEDRDGGGTAQQSQRLVQLLWEAFLQLMHVQIKAPHAVGAPDDTALRTYDASVYMLSETFDKQPLLLVDLFLYLSSIPTSIKVDHPHVKKLRDLLALGLASIKFFRSESKTDLEVDLKKKLDEMNRRNGGSTRRVSGSRAPVASLQGEIDDVVGRTDESTLLEDDVLNQFRAWIFCSTITALRGSQRGALSGFAVDVQRTLVVLCNGDFAQSLPDTPHVLNSKASGLSGASDPRTINLALQYARKARDMADNWPNINHTVARIIYDLSHTRLRNQVDLSEAKELLKKAMSLSPEYPKYAMTMSQVCLRNRESEQALAYADMALHLVEGLSSESEDDKEQLSVSIDHLYREINEWEVRNEVERNLTTTATEVKAEAQAIRSGLEEVRLIKSEVMLTQERLRQFRDEMNWNRDGVKNEVARFGEDLRQFKSEVGEDLDKYQKTSDDHRQNTFTYIGQVMTVIGLILAGLTYGGLSLQRAMQSGGFEVTSTETTVVNGQTLVVPTLIRQEEGSMWTSGFFISWLVGILVLLVVAWFILRSSRNRADKSRRPSFSRRQDR